MTTAQNGAVPALVASDGLSGRTPASPRLTIGYAFNPKKTSTFDARGLFLPPHPSVSFVPLDLTRPLAPQGPFDVLLVKLTDLQVAALHQPPSLEPPPLQHLRDYVAHTPTCVLIDSLDAVARVLDRSSVASLLRSAALRDGAWRVQPPDSQVVEVSAGEVEVSIAFPVICKPLPACGSPASHTFHLLSAQAQVAGLPHGLWLVQQLVPHGGWMWKVYVMAGRSYVVAKPSLPAAVTRGQAPPLLLDSQSMRLTTLEGEEWGAGEGEVARERAMDAEVVEVVERVSVMLGEVFGLTLFGYDVLLPEGEGEGEGRRLVVVDVNYFPSYNKVEGLSDKLVHVVREQHRRQMEQRRAAAGVKESTAGERQPPPRDTG